MATVTRRSRNSHIRARRSVTATPTGMSSRILNEAIDFLARRMLGAWPAITASCSAADSSFFVSVFASPTPMFRVIFSSVGTAIGVE
jgi:hypothetical protein